MKRLILTFLFLSFLFQLHSQTNHWTSSDLQQNGVTEVYGFEPISETKVYLTSNQGLCVFDLILNQYDTCYSLPLSRAKSSDFEYANSICWLQSDSGIVRFDGQQITSYGIAQGVFSDSINDIAVNSQGQLWISGAQGVAYFNQGVFVLDTAFSLHTILFDSLDRMIGIENRILINLPSLASSNPFRKLWLRNNAGWTSTSYTGLDSTSVFLAEKLVKTNNGQIAAGSHTTNDGYYTFHYPSRFQFHPLNYWYYFHDIKNLEIDINNRVWLKKGVYPMIFSTKDSIVDTHLIDDIGESPHFMLKAISNAIMILNGTKLYTAPNTIKENNTIDQYIDVNSINANASITGPIFNNSNQSKAAFEFPKGNNSHGVFAGNIVLISKKTNDTAFQVNQVNPYSNDFHYGPVSQAVGLAGQWIYKISKQEIIDHQNNYNSPNYQMPSSIANWKGNGDVSLGMAAQLAPYEDLNGNGIYEPHLGDYPKIKGDEAIYWINHKNDIEYHGMLYGFNRPNDSAIHQSLFLSYEIFNRSTTFIDSAKMGMFMDFDLGDPRDDYVGCDSLKNAFFVYNGDGYDDNFNGMNGYGVDPPYVGLKFITDSMDGFVYYNIGGGVNGDPFNPQVWMNYLDGRWIDGSPIRFGGNGVNNTTGAITRYMFTENWPEYAGPVPNAPGDRRGVGHVPWFSLQPNQSKTIEMVIGYAQVAGGGQLGSKTTMLNYLDSAQSFWESNIATSLYEPLKSDESSLLIYPNPTKSQIVVEVKGFKSTALQEPLQIYNLQGRLIQEVRIRNRRTVLNVTEFDQGMYILRYGNQVQKLVKQ